MVQTLEAIKGGGGSIRVGTTGKIGFLMTRELESVKSAPQGPVCARNKAAATTLKRSKPRKSLDEASSSGSSNSTRNPEITRKAKSFNQKTLRIPMLGSDDIILDRTPIREKAEKKGSYIVDIVDLKCGNTDRAWVSPITNRLKKLGFSKLSESIV